MRLRSLVPWVLAIGLAACTTPDGGNTPMEPAFAKGGGSTDSDSRAIWTIHELLSDGVTESALHGDGRDANGVGTAGESAYRGDVCGVKARIFYYDTSASQSGDAVFDPDGGSARSCARRYLHFALGETDYIDAPFTNVRDAMRLQVGESRLQMLRWTNSSIPSCEQLVYEGANEVIVSRLAGDDQGSAGVWSVESQAPHEATCYQWSKGNFVASGSYTVPFRITISEILAGT